MVYEKNTDWTVIATPVVRIDLVKDMADAPKDVLEFGCEGALDAYTGEPTQVHIRAMEHEYRYAGGHMHFGNPNAIYLHPSYVNEGTYVQNRADANRHVLAQTQEFPRLVKMLDLYVGVLDSYLFHDPRMFLRRTHYGKAGEYRIQQYPVTLNTAAYGQPVHHVTQMVQGLEYRTPSPMMYTNQAVIALMYGAANHVIRNYATLAKSWDVKAEPYIQHAINEGEGLDKIVETLMLPQLFRSSGLQKAKAWLQRGVSLNDFLDCPQGGHYNWPELPASSWGISMADVAR